MKAWYVSGEDSADIVFAEDLAGARRKGSVLLGDCDVAAERSPQWDEFAGLGYVPPEKLIDAGWWQICHQCGSRVDGDNEQEDEDGNECYLEPVFFGKKTFCCQKCSDAWQAENARVVQRQADARQVIAERFPACSVRAIYGGHDGYEVYASLSAPGLKYPVEWRSSDPEHVSIRAIDLEAWNKLKEGDRS